jgi:hypothetical protein
MQLLQVGIDTALPVLDILSGNGSSQLDAKLGFTPDGEQGPHQRGQGHRGNRTHQQGGKRQPVEPLVIENETRVGPGGILYSVQNNALGQGGDGGGGQSSLFPMFQY